MNEKPILFNTEMVQAILDGRKTQTRRVMKYQTDTTGLDGVYPDRYNRGEHWAFWLPDNRMVEPRTHKSPYGDINNELWVRETWATHPLNAQAASTKPSELHPTTPIYYKAEENFTHFTWRPPIFMPRWASRIQLEVTNVRIERVQDISEDDAWAEGISEEAAYEYWHDGPMPDAAFADLWDSINAKRGYSWESNPWVWVVEFRVKTVNGEPWSQTPEAVAA